MRKIILVTTLILVLMLSGCGTTPEKSADIIKEKQLDLTGNWAQEDKEFDEAYHAGYISGDRIEIFWMSDGGESSSLYWSGTYVAPQESEDEYAWDSVNDKTQTEYAMLASGDETKSFNYKDGKISYTASLMGNTATMYLVTTETDYMSIRTITESADTSNLQEVELVDSGYSLYMTNGRVDVMYALEMYNPNEEYAIEYPEITVTARDANGKILKTESQMLNGIAAGDKLTYGSSVSYEGGAPDKIEISVGNKDDNYIAQSSSGIILSSELSVFNVSKNKGAYSEVFTGEVTNNSTQDFGNVAITVIYKLGDKIVGGLTSYVDDLASGQTKAFELSPYSDFSEYDSFEINALQW